ncbi:MAG: cystathionine beta-lyase [Alphaproteobacteria bacterium]
MSKQKKNIAKETKVAHLGRDPAKQFGAVSPPVYHASTILFETVDEMEAAGTKPYGNPYYGRRGTPTQFQLQAAIAELEGADHCLLAPSGLAACTTALLAFVKTGDHILVTDSVYGPTRKYCDQVLKRMGVETTYYDPLIGAGIEELVRDNTAVIFLESPGSLTFEVQDVPAITKVARAKGIVTIIDNTWATPLYLDVFGLGVDICVQAATKYIVGHADAMVGTISCQQKHWTRLFKTHAAVGLHTAPDDAFLAARGLRTLATRLKQHEATGVALAKWLATRPEVKQVRHPALPGAPGHELWKRDFTGACGLFAIELNDYSDAAVHAMLDGMGLFGMGFSWGGFESLIMYAKPAPDRSATPWEGFGPLLRIHAGLENIDDLITDLDAGFERLRGKG